MPDPAVASFAEEVRSYRDLMLHHADYSGQEFLKAAYRGLSRILAAFHDLPLDCDTDFDEDDFEVDLGDLVSQIRGRFTICYWQFFDPSAARPPEEEQVCGDLSDDFCDILSDLLQGLSYYESGRPLGEGEAVFLWLQSYMHWGQHLTGALYALYWHAEDTWKFPLTR